MTHFVSTPLLAAAVFIGPSSAGQLVTLLAGLTLALFLVALGNAGLALVFRARTDALSAQVAVLHRAWEPAVLRFVLGDGTTEELDAAVSPQNALLFVGYMVPFTRRLAGRERERARTLVHPYLTEVRSRLTRRRPGVRARAVQTLAELGGQEYEREVVAALDDPSPLVAMVAARLICREETAHLTPTVLERLDRFSSWAPSLLAAMLASAGPATAPALRETLESEQRDRGVRIVAARALQELNDFLAADPAAWVAATTEDAELRAATLRLLGSVGRREHLEVVTRFQEDDQFAVRMAVADALGSLGGEAELDQLERMVECDPSSWVAIHAARGLLSAGRLWFLRSLADSADPRSVIATQVLTEGDR